MSIQKKASELLKAFKGDSYHFGLDVLKDIGSIASSYGKKALVISNTTYMKAVCDQVVESLKSAGMELAGDRIVPDAAPNAPREDVYRIESYILHFRPDVVISIGGGSSIDAAKAAIALATQGENSPEIESYFGTGLVSESIKKTGKVMLPHIAVQTSASSGAHLTKYSNVTDPVAGQKKLIVDEGIIPTNPLFDYSVTTTMPLGLTVDGALDGIAHCLEVFYGATEETYDKLADIMETALRLIVEYTPVVVKNPADKVAREAIGLATDLGGYAIMIGGTNGAHLTSFSLVDVTSHGRACGIMNPYYAVFFAPAVEKQLKLVGGVLKEYKYIENDIDALRGRELGMAVAEGLREFSRAVGCPVSLGELEGFTDGHIERALTAAKNPQLKMKLQNMPVPLTAEQVDEYMKPILLSAQTGDLSLIKSYAG
ncbi:iron-containing alcohol dehydrogenase [Spirochaeta isovalerica]|uniref:Alcohol dehydrogenase class IV n=1 Tax=Spirochaeta isovalerica TaxID=150 RepID=A0A841R4M3_9SPIO|nr:iron-containing alcohol dehydrogenase [Spirochaeta isovalerica]MBB6480084.1 alcohol dehydrogenase class IV [Spirochaeta isovalerica]